MPIPKTEHKYVENFKSISKLSVISKLLESIVRDYLYFDIKNILCKEQHGFIKQKSVETNLSEYAEYILMNLNNRVQVDVVYTDFSKAFDKINHDIMLDRLAELSVYGSLLKGFESYLSNRSQAAVIGKSKA